jgi:16S rRNA (cytidine1402-2'-O)-methyltransferase
VARAGRGWERETTQGSAAGRGALYVVATPIGNLQDLGARAIDVLASVDLILAEDTRHSAKLLGHYGIGTACRSFHEHNEARQVTRVVERVAAGEGIALISDAGTPLISDPGFRLVSALRERGLRVVPVPGPSAAISALSVAGLATDRFCFEGFLPTRASARRRHLQSLSTEERTLIFYESPRRVLQSVADMGAAFGPDRDAALAREMTKLHETIVAGSLAELHARLEAHPEQRRGEFVVVVAGAEPAGDEGVAARAGELLRALMEEMPVKQAVSVAARVTGAKRNALYRDAIGLAAAADTAGDEEE